MTAEDAYQELARQIVWVVGKDDWDSAKSTSSIWHNSTQTGYESQFRQTTTEYDRHPPFDMRIESMNALLFLRDDLLRTTGQRIWGLSFTLFPDGQFKIEYDYNKPEGYEESDEIITGDEINASLAKLTEQDNKPS
jgi:hypothetical protein